MKLARYIIAAILYFGAIILCIWLASKIPANHWGFAISVNFLFMLIFTIIFDMLFSPILLAKYFIPKPFEREGSIYRWFGVKYYKYILRLVGWEKIIRKNQSIKNKLESLINYELWTQGSEAIHLFSAITVIAFTIWIGWRYSISDIRWLIVFNILFNVYPVMLQRYNRPRINKLIEYHKLRFRNK